MNKFLSVMKGEVSLNENAVEVVRRIVGGENKVMIREELRPMRELLTAVLVEIQSLKAVKTQTESVQLTLSSPNKKVVGYDVIPRYGLIKDLAALSPHDRQREILRREIASKMFEYAGITGKTTLKDCIGVVYTPFYRKLKDKYAYYPPKGKVFSYLNPHRASKIHTLIDDGYGQHLIDILDLEINRAKSGQSARKPEKQSKEKTNIQVVVKKKPGRPRKVTAS